MKSLILIAAAFTASSSFAAITIPLSPSGTNILAHGDVPTEPVEQIFNQNGSLIAHPFHFAFDGIYTQLVTGDTLNTTNGNEPGHGTYPGLFGAFVPVGHEFDTLGVTATDGNRVMLSAKGLSLNISSAADYYYNTLTNMEHRIYRGGSLQFLEEQGMNYIPVLAYDNVAFEVTIDYANSVIDIGLVSATANSLGGTLQMRDLLDFSAHSINPITVSGDYIPGPGGRYGRYTPNSVSATFEQVPEPSSAFLTAAGASLLIMRRRRR